MLYCQKLKPHCLIELPRARMCLLLKGVGVACSPVSRTVFELACALLNDETGRSDSLIFKAIDLGSHM